MWQHSPNFLSLLQIRHMSTTRRQFLHNTGKLAVATGVGSILNHSSLAAFKRKITAPGDTIHIALIGCRNMGFGNLENALKQPGVVCTGLCDVDSNVLNQRSADVSKLQGKAPKQYTDYRRLLEVKDLDAVIIGTPDHWHCLPFVAACEAGKDIYVEKPLANSIAECDVMVKATRKHNRVVQVGMQQRSGPLFKKAMSLIQNGGIGQLRNVNIWANFNYGIGEIKTADSAIPAGVDYDMWLGPASYKPFNKTRFHGNWRMFWDYGGGLLTDWGVHLLDIGLWAKNITQLPLWVNATGGNFSYPDHAHETFDTLDVTYQLPDYTVHWQNIAGTQNGPYGKAYGLAFTGNDATLLLNRETMEFFPETRDGKSKVAARPNETGDDSHELHMQNFLECIKTRKDPVCTVENGRLVATYAHMGNIAMRTKSMLVWDEQQHNFGNNTAANQLIKPGYRNPWKLPMV